jgi:hypothetical protein
MGLWAPKEVAMTAQLPTRITIELHPGEGEGGWTARTAVDDAAPSVMPTSVMPPHAAEPREDLPVPAAYESAPCTCLEDGGCGADHAND